MKNIKGLKIELLPVPLKENTVYCSKCGGIGKMLTDNGYLENCDHPLCCLGLVRLCPTCGEPYNKAYTSMCNNAKCRELEREKRNEECKKADDTRFKKATKVLLENADTSRVVMMYSDDYGYNEGYFSELEELYDYIDEVDGVMPKYVWGTKVVSLEIDVDWVLENSCEELHEGAFDNIADIKELQDFVDVWCSKQTGTDSYAVDYSYAVIVEQ